VDDATTARIDALEAQVAALQQALDRKNDRAGAPAPADDDHDDGPKGFSRRRLLGAGTAVAAGAAGVVLATPSPALALTPATDVTVTPGGTLASTNAQTALIELDTEKAPKASPTFTGTSVFPTARIEDGQFKQYPVVDVRWYGALGNGSHDDTINIQLAIATAAASPLVGGTVYLPPGRYLFTGEIVVPDNVDLWGAGGHDQNVTGSGTVLQAGGANARLVFQGTGGQSGNFLVQGMHLASPNEGGAPAKWGLVYLGLCVERLFSALRVAGCVKDGIVVEQAQNCTFVQLMVADCERDGLVLDRGAGGNAFLRCEFSNIGRDSVRIRETYGGDGPYKEAQHNLFLHCILERGLSSNSRNNSMLNVTAGYTNKFSHCIFSLQNPPYTSDSGYLVLVGPPTAIGSPNPTRNAAVHFEDCTFGADVAHGIWNNGAGIHFTGINRFKCPTAIRWDNHTNSNAWGDTFGSFRFNGVTTRWTGTGDWANKAIESKLALLTTTETAQSWALRTSVAGETGYRFQVAKNGDVQLANGSDFVARATWKLQADGAGWETPDDVQLNTTLTIKESSPTLSVPAGDTAVVYMKADKLVVAYNHSGTMKYRTMSLTDTTATWTYSTVAP
jgi:hypothetical protein